MQTNVNQESLVRKKVRKGVAVKRQEGVKRKFDKNWGKEYRYLTH